MLEVNNLKTGYGKVEVVHNVSFTVPDDTVTGIIGRNGVGKTTTVKAICGYLPAFAGNVVFNGKDLGKLHTSKRARMGIAYVPQGHGAISQLTVEENLELGERLGQTHAKNLDSAGTPATSLSIDDVYKLFPRLDERRHQKAGTLSGGEQACLAIGRGVLSEPDLLILDEPSEGLQPNLVDMIGDVLNKIVSQYKLSVLLVEQNMNLIQSTCQQCYVIDKGVISGQLESDQIADQHQLQRYLTL